MKRRFLTTILALVAAVACLVGLVACGDGTADPVAGKTYVFEKVEITKGASGAVKDQAEALMNEMFQDDYIEFGTDGSFVITMYGQKLSGTYTQSGATVTATISGEDQKMKVSGDTVSMSGSDSGMSFKITYKSEKEETGTITSPAANVAGKTYVFKELAGISSPETEAVYAGATIAFDNNGGFTMTVMGSSESGTYTQNNANLTMSANDTTLTATVSGDEILLTISTAGIIFQLQEN